MTSVWRELAGTVTLLFAIVLIPDEAMAQEAAALERRWLAGASVGIPGYEDESIGELFTVGGNWTYFRPNRPGADVSLVVFPRAFQAGALAGGGRLGIALPIQLVPGFSAVPSTGASFLGVLGAGGGGGIAGFNWGVAGVITDVDGWGLRAGMSWHRFPDTHGAAWLLEVGLVRGPRPELR